MRKRAGFARALVLDPDIVLFDEPDSGLDPVRTALLCELIKEVHAENGGCYVVITHDIMSARRVAEHISVLWKGRIVESGPAQELFASENPFVRQFLSGESAGPARHGVSARRGCSAPSRASCGPRGAARTRCSLARRRARARRRRARAAPAPDGRGEHVRLELELRLPRDAALLHAASAKSRSRCSSRATCSSSCSAPTSSGCVGLEGCLSGNVPAAALAVRGRRQRAVRPARARAHGQGRARPGHVRQRGRRTRSTNSSTVQTHQAEAQARQAERGRHARGARARASRRRRRTRSAPRRSKLELGALPGEPRHARAADTASRRARASTTPASSDARVRLRPSPPGTPKQRFAYLFPSRDAALVSVRMRAGLSEAQRDAHDRADPQRRRRCGSGSRSTASSYLVTGEPVIVADLHELDHPLDRAAAVAVLLVMAATLGLVFIGRPRLLPLALALLAAALTFGALSLAGASLTMASVAVLPVLVGLAVDYAIQFQSRVGESIEELGPDGGGGERRARAPSPARPGSAPRRSRRPARRAPRRCSCCCSRRCRWCAASACCSSPASRSRCCAR